MSTLTIEQVKAIRKADTVMFRTDGDTTTLELVNRGKGIYDGDLRAVIPIDKRDQIYGSTGRTVSKAFAYIGSAQFDYCWKTIATLLRTGDRLTVLWLVNNTTENIRNAGLVADECQLIIERNKDTKLQFHVDTFCGLDNSARMVTQIQLKELVAA